MYKNLAEFEFGGHRSKVKVTRDKKDKVRHFSGAVLTGAVLGGLAYGVCLGKYL